MPDIIAPRFKGLLPIFDRRRVGEPYLVDAKNIYVGADGPITGFGHKEVFSDLLYLPNYGQAFTTAADTSSWFFTKGAILKVNWINLAWEIVFTFSDPTPQYPWTTAIVGGKHYFAKRGVGLLEYDPNTREWKNVNGITYGVSIPADIVGCSSSGGRLILLAKGILAWSNIDDGSIFTTSTATGAGFQSLGLIGSYTLDSLLGVYAVADGVFTFTSNGIMHSQLSNSIAVFRHTRVDTGNLPIDSWCIADLDDSYVGYLAKQGFYRTKGGVPELWNPEMGEYFRRNLVPNLKIATEGLFKLKYIPSKQWLCVSVAEDLQYGVYTRTFVYTFNTQEWGTFDDDCSFISDIYIDSGPELGEHTAFVDLQGNLKIFNSGSADLNNPTLPWSGYFYSIQTEMTPFYVDGIAQMPNTTYNPDNTEAAFANAGYYEIYQQGSESIEGSLTGVCG